MRLTRLQNKPCRFVKLDILHAAAVYASFQRIAEAVKIYENTAIVTGREIVVPKGKSPDAGKTINRRYTNIWMKQQGQWRLIARHASVICGQ